MRIAENGGHNAWHVITRPPAPPMNRSHGKPAPARPPGVVRIIGGDWRGTRLPVADCDGLRPTADRVRETLFNWLQPMLPGARVLDLFAGTGALGLEAVSRGAREAVLVERDPQLATGLRQLAAKLPGGERVQVIYADALSWLRTAPGGFDLAFVDPPFAGDLWAPALVALDGRMIENAWLYIESPSASAIVPGPVWRPHRDGQTRDVRYALYRCGQA
jgi:16S rRNA (guanine966-N2)-methyltransferase